MAIQINSHGNFKGELDFRVKCWDSETHTKGRIQKDGYIGYINIPRAGSNCVLTLSVASEYGHMWFNKIWYELTCTCN